jgi:hypothetical protein
MGGDEAVRLRAKVDANHAEVVKALREIGAGVLDLSRVGKGCPDLLVTRSGKTCLVEVKDGSKPPSARLLTPAQREFWDTWKGEILLVTSPKEARRLVEEWSINLL